MAALLSGGSVLLPVSNQETEPPLLSSDNAPAGRDEDASPGRARARPTDRSEREIDRDPLFERAGRNPGSAAHPNAPGRVRDDAPAWFEINHRDPPMPARSAFSLDPREPLPPVAPDARFHDVVRMSDDTRADDFPAIAANPADRDDVWMI
ncbi:MAG: hypothetical protein L0206_05115, partial [Actinobacteria bacterium]|nr:hypothetical protein [Actinomycetota bacterium]